MDHGLEFEVLITDNVTGADDNTAHTVRLQPIDQAYPTGALVMAQKTERPAVWGFASNVMDENMHYDLYVNASKKKRYQAFNAIANLG